MVINGEIITEELMKLKMLEVGLPAYMAPGIWRYLEHHISPGSFLAAILSNDFMGAVRRADYANSLCLREWASFLYNDLPFDCHGSRRKYLEWLAERDID